MNDLDHIMCIVDSRSYADTKLDALAKSLALKESTFAGIMAAFVEEGHRRFVYASDPTMLIRLTPNRGTE